MPIGPAVGLCQIPGHELCRQAKVVRPVGRAHGGGFELADNAAEKDGTMEAAAQGDDWLFGVIWTHTINDSVAPRECFATVGYCGRQHG